MGAGKTRRCGLGQADTMYRISELEHKIGAGLIEEVIQVAEGEVKLVDVMLKAKV